MSTPIDESRVRHIAKLARLHLSDQELRLFTTQLANIVDYVAQIDALDTRGVEPLAHPLPVENVTRDDRPTPPLPADQALANAPQTEQGHFRVPAVLDPGSE